jgi:transcriptional regulator with XRE-family HTH domain
MPKKKPGNHAKRKPRKTLKASREVRWRLAENLKRLRDGRGYTQEDLGQLSRLNKNSISNIERATELVNITLATLEALAKGLGCPEDELLKRRTGP